MCEQPPGPAASRWRSQSTLRPLRSATVSRHLLDTLLHTEGGKLLCRTSLCSRERSATSPSFTDRREAGGSQGRMPVSCEASPLSACHPPGLFTNPPLTSASRLPCGLGSVGGARGESFQITHSGHWPHCPGPWPHACRVDFH